MLEMFNGRGYHLLFVYGQLIRHHALQLPRNHMDVQTIFVIRTNSMLEIISFYIICISY